MPNLIVLYVIFLLKNLINAVIVIFLKLFKDNSFIFTKIKYCKYIKDGNNI